MSSNSPPSIVTPRTVAAIVGGACILALALATYRSEGSAFTVWGVTVLAPLVVGLVSFGLLVLVVWRMLRSRRSVPRRAGRGPTIDESEIRTVLERWYPGWDDRTRARVAAAIGYHRRRGG